MNGETTLVIYSQDEDTSQSTLFDTKLTTFDKRSTVFTATHTNSGRIDVYDRYLTKWVYSETLETSSEESDGFGLGFAVGANHILVGSPYSLDSIFKSGKIYDYYKNLNSLSWNVLHYEIDKPDPRKIKKAFLYNKLTGTLIKYLDVIDVSQGKIAGLADEEVKFKTFYDPAIYSTGTAAVVVDSQQSWDKSQTGMLWWNLSTAKFIDCYDNDVVYRNTNWNTLATGSSIDIYEWVESTVLPSVWDARADTTAGLAANISGTSLYGDAVYSKVTRFDTIAQTNKYTYYFWVKNKKIIPNIAGRYLSASNVAMLIANPRGYNYSYLALTGPNSFSLANVTNDLIDTNVVLSVESDSILGEDGTNVLSEFGELAYWDLNVSNPPVITKQPSSATIKKGNNITFSIEATGTAPLTYQWKVNGSNVFGETNSTYKITNASADKIGITCTVSNLAADVLSNSVNLIVGTPPVITKQPTTQSISKGSKVSMSVVVTGSSPFAFQWSKDGSVISGATSDTYTINTAALTDAGSYSCTVSNIFDSVTSNNAVLTVNNNFDAGDLIIAADTNNFVLKDALITKGWDTTLPVIVNVYVNSGVTVGSNSTSLPAFKVDSFPAGSVIKLTNNGSILGAGGNGGIASSGGAGGTALNVNNSIIIINNNIIGGGGGGGGAGGYSPFEGDAFEGGHGGGGSGAIPGSGEVTIGNNSPMATLNGFGGVGGAIGSSGADGGNIEISNGDGEVSFRSFGYAGGVAGYYIEGNSFVTWTIKGSVKGNVK
jgi:hypothetical protein